MRSRLTLLLPFLALLLLPAWCRAQEEKGTIRLERDLVYGKGGNVDLKLNLALPNEGDGPFPAIVCIHGGGWKSGKRDDLNQTIQVFASRGYIGATISYRLVDVATFPAQIEDCKAAVRWLRANAKQYKIDPERIGATGYSAGAHLACLLGTSSSGDGLEGNGGCPEQSSRIQAVVSFFGPTDLSKNRTDETDKIYLIPFVGATFEEKPELYRKASPITYAKKESPPFLFIHGSEDKLVSIEQSKMLSSKLQGLGVSAKLIIVEGEGHGWGGVKLLDSLQQMMVFFDQQLKARK